MSSVFLKKKVACIFKFLARILETPINNRSDGEKKYTNYLLLEKVIPWIKNNPKPSFPQKPV
jgi:hypothetical protein